LQSSRAALSRRRLARSVAEGTEAEAAAWVGAVTAWAALAELGAQGAAAANRGLAALAPRRAVAFGAARAVVRVAARVEDAREKVDRAAAKAEERREAAIVVAMAAWEVG